MKMTETAPRQLNLKTTAIIHGLVHSNEILGPLGHYLRDPDAAVTLPRKRHPVKVTLGDFREMKLDVAEILDISYLGSYGVYVAT